MKKSLSAVLFFAILSSTSYAQSATSTVPISIGLPCGNGDGITDSIMYFTFDPATASMKRLSACRPNLASPGISAYNTGVSFNPADGYLYFVRYTGDGSYVWRWKPETCPDDVPVYQYYPNQTILGLDFDANGIGYQIIFTGNYAPFGLALQKVDFSTGTFGPIEDIDLQGKQINTQNGDMVITSGGQFLMVWDNLYFSLNYADYNTTTPLKATYISDITLGGSTKLVGLAYAQGKLVGSTSDCGYYDFNILTGKLTNLADATGLQFATDMTNITSGLGAAKKLVSATPVSAGVYDLVYDIRVENFGDYPISNLQVTDDLTTIHPSGGSVISSVSTQWIENPAGITLNPSYNGKSNKNLIATSPAQQLPNFPVSNNYFIIRLKFRMSSVVSGVVYNNNAVASGTGYSSISIKDSSTNGSSPDLNSNFKPDDAGENQSTPFSISVAAETPPCSSINTILYSQDFGSGTGVSTTMPGSSTTQYAPGTNPMDEETYMITNNASNGNDSKYNSLTDHTGGANGRMLLVNADVNNYKLFENTVNVTCANVKYSLLVYAANVMNDTYNTFCDAFGGTSKPRLTFIIRNASTNGIIANYSTDEINNTTWTAFGMKWVMPSGVTSIKIQIYNTGEGGCGNAVAIDDIQFGLCDPMPYVATTLANAGCLGTSSTFAASLSDTTGMSSTLQYQWQSYNSAVTGWLNIPLATTNQYTINPVTSVSDQPSYRMILSANGNSGNTACQYTSNTVKLTLKDSSSQAASIKSNKAFACVGSPVILSVVGGSLGTNASWLWYQQSCGGTYAGTGSTLNVTMAGTTAYYVRAAGDCNTTECVNITLQQLCILADEAVTLKGTLYGKYASLNFTILADQKIKSYQIERSINGIDFTAINRQEVDNYADKNGYTVKDDLSQLTDNNFYYRANITAANGATIYSKVVTLSRSSNAYYTMVSPNPANNTAKLIFNSSEASKVEIKLFSMQGQLMRTSYTMSVIGTNSFYLTNLDRLPAGIYNISVTDAGKTTHAKVIIQH